MVTDCCMRYFGMGEVVCPVCMSQLDEHKKELEAARAHQAHPGSLDSETAELIRRRALPRSELGMGGTRRPALEKNPNRRAVFRLLGIYLPEREAKALLRNIHEYKWIEAEKAGFDVWAAAAPSCPLRVAAADWASKYLNQFLAWTSGHQPLPA